MTSVESKGEGGNCKYNIDADNNDDDGDDDDDDDFVVNNDGALKTDIRFLHSLAVKKSLA